VHALTAHRNVARLEQQCRQFRPELAVLDDAREAGELQQRLHASGLQTRVRAGRRALEEVAGDGGSDTVIAGIVGAAGLASTLAAVNAGKRILLANKEALVMAGQLFMDAVVRHGATLLPLDSEHNAVFQCLPSGFRRGELVERGVARVLLTASGGPFRCLPTAQLAHVTPEQACAHPNWNMGRKISVDSATLMNKGLEMIEACWLFGLPGERVDVVVHPQSIIHSLVEYVDGSMLAQLGNPDMRTPIAHALAYPERIGSGVAGLDLVAAARLDFEPPDVSRFPCLSLAYQALEAGGDACISLNAANEVAVDAFLHGKLRFTQIADLIQAVLERLGAEPVLALDDVFSADERARSLARERVGGFLQ
ncbi:MAG: 1-deoxy-D-xylulose-5-phosphate reductoisomerase, partial [Ectothiorhodospiraceae bacterium]|nr:1-deoxy-D-xylulose-5-phosphate reductoisomerase [Ectothiorhodospiraceae bacterium]